MILQFRFAPSYLPVIAADINTYMLQNAKWSLMKSNVRKKNNNNKQNKKQKGY